MTGIYKYTNLINGSCYIGQAVDLVRRHKDHKVRYCSPTSEEYNSVIHQAFRKYGIENFTYEVLEECGVDQLNDREIYWIAFYDSYNNGYNCGPGGSEKHFCKFNTDILASITNDLQNTDMIYQDIANKHSCSIGFVSDFNAGKLWKQDGVQYPLRQHKRNQRFCTVCNTPISKDGVTGMCSKCYAKSIRTVERPSAEQLLEEVATSSFAAVGRKYNLTDNAIRKWCKTYGLPTRAKEIKDLYNHTFLNT